ncbi:MAG: hypothetical protein ACJAWL_003214 [Motiliproteus sp.]|jgi:hypothetical protein
MLTYEDCLEVSGLTQDEVDAVAEFEHSSRLPALAECDFLLHCDGGVERIRHMIIDDLRHAQSCGQQQHARDLRQVLIRFDQQHDGGKTVN